MGNAPQRQAVASRIGAEAAKTAARRITERLTLLLNSRFSTSDREARQIPQEP
jgi:hypothetical protein